MITLGLNVTESWFGCGVSLRYHGIGDVDAKSYQCMLCWLCLSCRGSPSPTPSMMPVPPGPPFSVVAVTIPGNDTATVSWDMPVNFGGASVLANCSVVVAPAAAAVPPAIMPFPIATASFGNLTYDVGYAFTVSCANNAGYGPPSLPSNVVYPSRGNQTVPGPPLYPTVLGTTTSSATVSFLPPMSSGGAAVSRYTLGVTDTVNGSSWTVDAVASSISGGVTVAGLVGGRNYSACVWAWNAVGEGAASVNVSVVPIAPPPPAPTNVRGVGVSQSPEGRGGVNVTWDAVSSAHYAHIVYTVVPYPDGSPVNVTDVTSVWVYGLNVYEAYFFRVRATVLGAGSSALSQQVSGRVVVRHELSRKDASAVRDNVARCRACSHHRLVHQARCDRRSR